MGFFSCVCPGCNQSLRSTWSVNDVSSWMKDVVLLSTDNNTINGEYSGYGKIILNKDYSIYVGRGTENTTLYHRVCWGILDCPQNILKNGSAKDQGYFVGDFHPEKPRYKNDLETLRKIDKLMESQ